MRKFFSTLLLLVSITSCAYGTIYHVATDGSGDFTTIAQVNAATFSDGDEILFRCGDTWDENLVIIWSGNSVSSIDFMSYGTGNKPILSKINSLTGASYWNVSDIEVKQTTSNGAVNIVGGTNIVFDNCTIDGNGKVNTNQTFTIYGDSTYGWCEYITVKNCLFKPGSNTCNFSIRGMAKYIYIENNIAYDADDNNFQAYNSYYLIDKSLAPHNIYFIGNESYGSVNHGIEFGWGVHDSIIDSNYIHDCGVNYWDNGVILADAGENNIIKNNIFKNNYTDITIQVDNPARGTSNNNKIYNNTHIGFKSIGVWVRSPMGTTNEIKNDIFYTSGNIPQVQISTGYTAVFDYNLYYSDTYNFSNAGTTYASLSDWQTATGQDANSIVADPLLRSATDYRLQSSSPCIDSGINLDEVTDDYYSTPRPLGGQTDIGATEYYKAKVRGNATLRHSTI